VGLFVVDLSGMKSEVSEPMSNSQWQNEIPKLVRVPQIVVGALVVGAIVFLVVAIGISQIKDEAAVRQDAPVMTYGAIALAGFLLVLSIIVAAVVVAAGRRKIADGTWQPPGSETRGMSPYTEKLLETMGDAGKLWYVYISSRLIAVAIPEGGVFLLLVAYFTAPSTLTLVVAAGLIVAMATRMPSVASATRWVEQQLKLVEDERLLRGG
jgi:hypothetical protein